MVELLASIKGDKVYSTYLPQLEKEYNYWMDKTTATKHVVKMPNGTNLNRYYDKAAIPRQESYKADAELSDAKVQELAMRIRVASPEALKKILDDERAKVCRDLRSGAESGWDFSSRWFADEQQINTIQTTQYIPVDLNCLLYQLENCIAKAKALAKQKTGSNTFKQLAAKRKAAILKYCWNASSACFYDYNLVTQTQSTSLTAAAFFPLFVKIASAAQAKGVIAIAQKNLFKPGGVVTTTKTTGQQWDAPNGWAPLQWITVKGLLNYKFNIIANNMASRWIKLNDKVYQSTGKMMEKYNVEDLNKEAGGGEYPSQDGFGWTNGVYLAFKALLSKK
jgi:alpha,alpha-trehalase